MGTCGPNEHKGKKNKKNNKKVNLYDNSNKKTNGDYEIREIKDINEIKEIKELSQEREDIKLRSNPKKTNLTNIKYQYILKDSTTTEEYSNEIDGDKTIKELLDSLKLRSIGDFIIEFENKIKIGYEKKNESFSNIIIELFNNDIPEIIKMKYSYKGLEIPENINDIINEYIDSNKIIGNAILDNDELFCIITYEKDMKVLTPYYYKRKDNEDLTKFNLFTAFCNGKGKLYFSGGESEQEGDPDKTVAKYNNFFYVDLKNLKENKDKIIIEELPNLNESRTWHSMIYVPHKYIFIVGGSNTKS